MKEKIIYKLIFVVLPFVFFLAFPNSALAFRFVSWADSKTETSSNRHNDLATLSKQAKLLNPIFTIYPGDLQDDGFTVSGMNDWKAAMNGDENNGMFDITFTTRGNHDTHVSGTTSGWQAYFDMRATAQRIGASNYTELNEDLTYSFDYGNSRFIGVDVDGGVSRLTTAQINWIDQRLTDAESRGLTHAFIFFHGPIYCVNAHCTCTSRTGCVPTDAVSLIKKFNNHPVVSATFHGHEHVYTYTHIDSSRIPEATRSFEQFVTGDAGAGGSGSWGDCRSRPARHDYFMDVGDHGFTTIDVSGSSYTVTWYKRNSTTPQKKMTFTKSGVTSPPTPTSTPTPRLSPTPTPTSRPTPTPTPRLSPTPTPTPGDYIIYEAEGANLTNAQVETEHLGFTGSGYVNFLSLSGGRVSWDNLSVSSGGYYNLTFRYALGVADRAIEIRVNGSVITSSLNFPSTGVWTNWSTLNLVVPLNPGNNTLEAITIGADGPNLDHLKVPTNPSPIIPLSQGWNQITWPNLPGIKASDIPPECPIVVARENFWFLLYVKGFGGLNFSFENGRSYYLRCNQETVWHL